MLTGHWPIPNVRQSLEKIQHFSLFSDIDLTNSFHQIPIDEFTSNLLSVQTPWGCVRPLFLPEGVPQGSGLLQEIMTDIFSEYFDWTIVIFDNLLVLAHDMDDMLSKVKKILKRAVEYNLVFKMKKTWLGVKEVTFFGYVCKEHTYSLSADRTKGIMDMEMPKNKKAVKRFLGCSGFFLPFVPMYSSIVAPIHDMTKDSFSWNESDWKLDYLAVFSDFKSALIAAATLFYPDYDLDWLLRGDASELGVGCVLLQLFPNPDQRDKPTHQPLLFASKKFSEQAKKWSTYAQEAFAMYFAFKSCEYYIRGKPFIYQGDHANLAWMERSTEAKVIRWRLYMQGFPMKHFEHISGPRNEVSDWQSRFEDLCEVSLSDFDLEMGYSDSDIFWNMLNDDTSYDQTSVPESSDLLALTRSASSKIMSGPTVPALVSDPVLAFPGSTDLPIQEKLDPEISISSSHQHSDQLTRYDMLKQCHSGRAGHLGIRRTYAMLNEHFPGHGISQSQVKEFKERCPICQKTEDYMGVQLVPIVRHLKTSNPGKVVGMDYLSITLDKFGMNGLHVLRDHFSKFIYAVPTREHNAESAALAIFLYCVLYGAFDILMTDPGSDYMSEAVSQVNQWFGIHHRVSLVDRHESNGVEGGNKQTLRHLSKLFMTERIKDEWSSPQHVGWACYIINKYDVSESGCSPYDLTFGRTTDRRFDFSGSSLDPKQAHQYVRILDNSLKALTVAARTFQNQIVDKRTSSNRSQNLYQKDDLVLFRLPRDKPRPHKLHPIYLGPYRVVTHVKNEVEAQHMATGAMRSMYVADLKSFFGSHEEARQLAAVDADQYLVSSVSAYRGDPFVRSNMYFYVEYSDSDNMWIPWSLDLQNCEAYHTYCASVPALKPLLLPSALLTKWTRDHRKKPISGVSPSDKVLVDIRAFGSDWYATLDLPNRDIANFLVPCTYGSLSPNRRSINLTCPLLKRSLLVDNVFISLHGNISPPAEHLIVDKDLIAAHPSLLTSLAPDLPSVRDYEYLIGKKFYDSDARSSFTVTRISVTRTNDIVAYVRPIRSDGRASRESSRPYHVADVACLTPVV